MFFFFSSRRRHTSWPRDWSSDVCSSDLFGQFWSALLDDLCDLMGRVVDQRWRMFTVEPRHLASMLVGTWEMSLRGGFIAGSQRDATVLRQTLPAVLVALTKVKP